MSKKDVHLNSMKNFVKGQRIRYLLGVDFNNAYLPLLFRIQHNRCFLVNDHGRTC